MDHLPCQRSLGQQVTHTGAAALASGEPHKSKNRHSARNVVAENAFGLGSFCKICDNSRQSVGAQKATNAPFLHAKFDLLSLHVQKARFPLSWLQLAGAAQPGKQACRRRPTLKSHYLLVAISRRPICRTQTPARTMSNQANATSAAIAEVTFSGWQEEEPAYCLCNRWPT